MILTQLLNEANVYNLDLLYNGYSIKQFINSHIANLTNPTVKKVLAKKLTTLLQNDETNLQPIRQLPKDAPDWAQKSVGSGQLMVFIPSEQLNDEVSNIVHYIQAAEQNTHHEDNNIVVRAQRELSSIPKIASLQDLATKANQYFAAGQKQLSKNIEGMVEVANYNDWIWYKLDTPESFTREGKTLQNCIGTHWTYEKTKKEGMEIYILRTPANDSVVAIRANINDRQIQEVKGKNNKPPVSKYMPYVFHFVKDSSLSLSNQQAKNELTNAGYHVFNDKYIVPIEQAIHMYYDPKTDKLMKRDSSHNTIIQIFGSNFTLISDPEEVRDVQQMVRMHSNQIKHIIIGSINGEQINIGVNVAEIAVIGGNPPPDFGKYLIKISKQLQFGINDTICMTYGVTTTEPRELIEDKVEFLGTVGEFDKFDVSNLDGHEKWLAATHLPLGKSISNPYFYPGGVERDFSAFLHDHKITNSSKITTIYRSYKNNYPADILLVGNDVVISTRITSYDILDSINDLMKQDNLTIVKSAVTDKKLVAVPPNTIMTKAEYQSQKMNVKYTPVIELADGSKFELMQGNDLKELLHTSKIGTSIDSIYKLIIDNKTVLYVPIVKGKVSNVFIPSEQAYSDKPYGIKTISFEYATYLKALAKKLKLNINTSPVLFTLDSKWGRIMSYLEDNPNTARTRVLADAKVAVPMSAPGLDAPYNTMDKPLIQLGLISVTQKGNSYLLSLTDSGKKLLKQLKSGKEISGYDLVKGVEKLKGERSSKKLGESLTFREWLLLTI